MKPPPSLIPIPAKTLVRAIYWTVLAAFVVAFTAWWLAVHHSGGKHSSQEAKGQNPARPADTRSWRLEVASELTSEDYPQEDDAGD